MVDNQKIDLLFQDKLSGMEVTPSEDGWNTVQLQLNNKQTKTRPVWYYAAASIAILITVLVALFPTEERKTFITAMNDHPIRPTEVSWSIHLPEKPVKQKEEETIKQTKVIRTHHEPIIAQEVEKPVLEMPELNTKPVQSLTLNVPEHPSLEGIAITEKQNVKITYIPGEKTSDSSGSVSLARVINAAQQVSPADLLADLRTAKNQFLSRN